MSGDEFPHFTRTSCLHVACWRDHLCSLSCFKDCVALRFLMCQPNFAFFMHSSIAFQQCCSDETELDRTMSFSRRIGKVWTVSVLVKLLCFGVHTFTVERVSVVLVRTLLCVFSQNSVPSLCSLCRAYPLPCRFVVTQCIPFGGLKKQRMRLLPSILLV